MSTSKQKQMFILNLTRSVKKYGIGKPLPGLTKYRKSIQLLIRINLYDVNRLLKKTITKPHL